jgi:hypothetical protein
VLRLFESFEWRASKRCSYSAAPARTEWRFFGWSTARETSKHSCVAKVLTRERRGARITLERSRCGGVSGARTQ